MGNTKAGKKKKVNNMELTTQKMKIFWSEINSIRRSKEHIH